MTKRIFLAYFLMLVLSFSFQALTSGLAAEPPSTNTNSEESDPRLVGPTMTASEFLDEAADDVAAPFSEESPSVASLTPSPKPRFSKAGPDSGTFKKSKESEAEVLPGGRIKMSGRYRLAFGVDTEDVIVNDSNADLQERNFRYLFGEQRENTFDQAIYQKFLLNVDFSPQDKFNFYTQIVADPWSYVGTSGDQEITEPGGGSTLRANFKYFGAMNSVLNEIYVTDTGNQVGTPLTKVHNGHTTAFTSQGFYTPFPGTYNFPETDIDFEFRPIRKMWMDYTEDQWHARVFALADQEQALTTDDPLELSNHKDYWQWSPWIEEYKPIRFFTDGALKRGYYSNALAYLAKDSEGNRLVLLKGASFEGDFGKTYLAATVASPYTPWDEHYFDNNNIPGAVRLKHQLTDAWMIGGTYTFRGGLIDNSMADFGEVAGIDTKYQINDAVVLRAEVAGSHRDLDMMTDDRIETDTEGYAYKGILDANFDHKLDGHTDFQFSFTKMDTEFDPLLSRYYTTKDDKFWGKHLTFREIDPGLDYFRLGDGVDINRYVFRINWKEKLFKERFENLFDVRNVHRSSNDGYIETVLRNEATFHINSRWTAKGLFRWHGLPSTHDNKEPFISNFYFDSNSFDQTRSEAFLENVDVPADRDPSRFTYSGGLEWIVYKELTVQGFIERSNDIPDFPRGLLGYTYRDTNARVENLLLYRTVSGLYGQTHLKAVPPYPYFTVTRERVIYKPEDRLTYTLHAAQNGYKDAAGIDDNVNHIGLSVNLDYTKRLTFFFDYTFSQQIDIPKLIVTNYAESDYKGHHNVYASAQYKVTDSQLLIMEYGAFGYGFENENQPLISPYSGVPWALPTVDTEHLFRVSLNGEF